MMSSREPLDVLIIGAGPAGLSTATGLARQLYTAVVFDSGKYRNAAVQHMHNVLTWDHANPADFRRKGRDDILARYDIISFEDVQVKSVAKTSKGLFEAIDARGRSWLGRKLVLATGITDVMPDIKGYDECWGRGIFHCLFCHGYEERSAPSAGVLAIGDVADPHVVQHVARMAHRLVPNVTVYTDGSESLAAQTRDILVDDDVKIDSRRIDRLGKGFGETEVDVCLADGTRITEGFLVHKPKSRVNGPFAQQLGLELTDAGDIKTNGMFHESSVEGVFAVGDCGTLLKSVTQAVAMGSFAAGGLVSQLQVPVPKGEVEVEL